jgi:hypothetical protein
VGKKGRNLVKKDERKRKDRQDKGFWERVEKSGAPYGSNSWGENSDIKHGQCSG